MQKTACLWQGHNTSFSPCELSTYTESESVTGVPDVVRPEVFMNANILGETINTYVGSALYIPDLNSLSFRDNKKLIAIKVDTGFPKFAHHA